MSCLEVAQRQIVDLIRASSQQFFQRDIRLRAKRRGVLPLQFHEGITAQSLGIDGSEVFSITGLIARN